MKELEFVKLQFEKLDSLVERRSNVDRVQLIQDFFEENPILLTEAKQIIKWQLSSAIEHRMRKLSPEMREEVRNYNRAEAESVKNATGKSPEIFELNAKRGVCGVTIAFDEIMADMVDKIEGLKPEDEHYDTYKEVTAVREFVCNRVVEFLYKLELIDISPNSKVKIEELFKDKSDKAIHDEVIRRLVETRLRGHRDWESVDIPGFERMSEPIHSGIRTNE